MEAHKLLPATESALKSFAWYVVRSIELILLSAVMSAARDVSDSGVVFALSMIVNVILGAHVGLVWKPLFRILELKFSFEKRERLLIIFASAVLAIPSSFVVANELNEVVKAVAHISFAGQS